MEMHGDNLVPTAATDVSAPVEATILVAAKARLESDPDVKDAVRALLTLHSNLGGLVGDHA